jgi:hypothetical protein
MDTNCNYQTSIFVPGPASGKAIKNVRGVRGKLGTRQDLRPAAVAAKLSQLPKTWYWS